MRDSFGRYVDKLRSVADV